MGGLRRKTRRGGTMSEGLRAQAILRAKQTEHVQDAREAKIQELAAAIRMRNNKNRMRPGWKRPSAVTLAEITRLLDENDRLLAKGRGRRVTRRR